MLRSFTDAVITLPISLQISHSDGDSFFLACEDFWKKVGSFIPRLRFFIFFLSGALLEFQSLGQGQFTVAQRAETTVSHTMPGQRHSQPTPTSLGQGSVRVYV